MPYSRSQDAGIGRPGSPEANFGKDFNTCDLSHRARRHPIKREEIKGGAVEFLTKPVDEEALLASIERALRQHRMSRQKAEEHGRLVARYESLTLREREVFPLLARGFLNKQAAFELGITEYTVQIHRGHIMRKMEADSFATLVKLASKLRRPAHLTGTRKRVSPQDPVESGRV